MNTKSGEKKLYRINLHMHTTDSDGRRSPEEAVEIYKAAGCDVGGDPRRAFGAFARGRYGCDPQKGFLRCQRRCGCSLRAGDFK